MNIRAKVIVPVIGWIEILIGVSTLLTCFLVQFFGILDTPPKPANVFFVVTISAAISLSLGIGLLKRQEWARKLLIFFSGYIVISKIFIYSGLLTFSGEIFTFVSTGWKDSVSFLYHIAVIIFLFKRKDLV